MKNVIRVMLMLSLAAALWRPSAAMGQFFFLENENIGKPVKDFTLKVAGAQKQSLSQFREGKKAIIFFWATWCPHCRRELNQLHQTQEQIAQKGIKIVLVDVGEEERLVQEYMQKNKMDMAVFLDADSSVAESYALVGVPTFYFVDAGGIVRDVQHNLPEDYEKILSGS